MDDIIYNKRNTIAKFTLLILLVLLCIGAFLSFPTMASGQNQDEEVYSLNAR